MISSPGTAFSTGARLISFLPFLTVTTSLSAVLLTSTVPGAACADTESPVNSTAAQTVVMKRNLLMMISCQLLVARKVNQIVAGAVTLPGETVMLLGAVMPKSVWSPSAASVLAVPFTMVLPGT